MRRTYYDEEDTIDLLELFYALKRKILIILIVGILAGGLGYAYTRFLTTPVYTSTSSMLVLTKETTLASLADIQMGSQLTNDYEVLITSRPVLNEVIEELNLNITYKDLRNLISIENPADTRILKISVQYYDPKITADIVNVLSEVSAEFIGDKMEVVPPKIIENGEIPVEKTDPSMRKNVLIGLLAGLCLSGGVVVLTTLLDDTIKTEEDVAQYLGLSTLAIIPDRKDFITGKKKGKNKKAKQKKKQEGR